MEFMGFREYLDDIDKKGLLKKVDVEVSKKLEISGILKKMEPTPVMFNNVKNLNSGLLVMFSVLKMLLLRILM